MLIQTIHLLGTGKQLSIGSSSPIVYCSVKEVSVEQPWNSHLLALQTLMLQCMIPKFDCQLQHFYLLYFSQESKIIILDLLGFSYSAGHWKRTKAPFMLQICTFQEGLVDVKSAATPQPSWLIFTTTETFPMRYCMTLNIKVYQKYDKSQLNIQFLCSKFRCFNFELSYFQCSLNFRVIQCLFGKVSVVVNVSQEG